MTSRPELEYRIARDEDMDALIDVIGQALHVAPDRMRWVIQSIGPADMRAVTCEGRIVGGVAVLKMGQWLGGRRVAMGGIAAVGVAPEWRGRGVASTMMKSIFAELRAEGIAISTLFAATLAFYRALGYERAGIRNIHEVELTDLPKGDRSLGIEPVAPSEEADLRAFYEKLAPGSPGFLDRHPFVWEKTLNSPDEQIFKYRVVERGETRGYIVFAQPAMRHTLRIVDIAAADPAAWQRLLAFLADHRSIIKVLSWPGSPSDPLLHLLPEQTARVTNLEDWAVRIVDIKGALEARGYPEGLAAECHLEVEDETIEENAGRYILRVARGRGEVEPGGKGDVKIGARGLAGLYTGHLPPRTLRSMGLAEGPDDRLDTLASIFAGPSPWMREYF